MDFFGGAVVKNPPAKNKYCMLTHIYGIKKKKKGSEELRGRTGIKTQK